MDEVNTNWTKENWADKLSSTKKFHVLEGVLMNFL